MNKIIESSSKHRFNFDTFFALATTSTTILLNESNGGITLKGTPKNDKKEKSTFDHKKIKKSVEEDMTSVDLLFNLLDINKDGKLTYYEILKKLEKPTTIIIDLIESNDALQFLVSPPMLKRALLKMKKMSVNQTITREIFRLYVASLSRVKVEPLPALF